MIHSTRGHENHAISRVEFLWLYQATFDALFEFNEHGNCVVREREDWKRLLLNKTPLMGLFYDIKLFRIFTEFISTVPCSGSLIFTEVESLDSFTVTRVIRTDKEILESVLIESLLPNFQTACFDECGNWCALFDNQKDSVLLCKAGGN